MRGNSHPRGDTRDGLCGEKDRATRGTLALYPYIFQARLAFSRTSAFKTLQTGQFALASAAMLANLSGMMQGTAASSVSSTAAIFHPDHRFP